MAFYKKFLPRKRTVPNLYDVQSVSNGSTISDIPSNIQQEGTALKAEFFNSMQSGNVNTVMVSKVVEFGIEIYEIQDFEGIQDLPIDDNLKFKFVIPSGNETNNPKIRLNGIDYTLMRGADTGLVQLKSGDLQVNSICNLIFSNTSFIVENGSLKGTETTAGIISGLDIRSREAAYILGAAYGGTFGTALTSIEKGKVYYYWDSVKKSYTPYQALRTTTKIGGFITPDAGLFKNISNTNLSYTIVDDTNTYKIYFDRQTNILKIIKKNTAKMTLEFLVTRILNFIANSDYTILSGTIFSNFNTTLVSSDANVYTGYGIFRSVANGIMFFYGENNTQINNNSAYYFHSGEISIQMEAK